MAVKKGIDGRCRWHGWVERSTALDVMRRAHVFVITSLRDLTSTVVVEALALGLPVICTDLCGFADVVTNACGLKVPVQSHEKIEYGLRAAIVKLADDEGLRMKFALGAVERAKAYSWKIKAKRINEIYRDVMSC